MKTASKGAAIGAFAVGCLVGVLLLLFVGRLQSNVVREDKGRDIEIRLLREWKFPGAYNLVLETRWGLVTARTPLVIALDPLSDDMQRFAVRKLSVSDARDMIMVDFEDGSTARVPLFMGATSKAELPK